MFTFTKDEAEVLRGVFTAVRAFLGLADKFVDRALRHPIDSAGAAAWRPASARFAHATTIAAFVLEQSKSRVH